MKLASTHLINKNAEKKNEAREKLLPLFSKLEKMFEGSGFFILMVKDTIAIGTFLHPNLQFNKVTRESLALMAKTEAAGGTDVYTSIKNKFCSISIDFIDGEFYRVRSIDTHNESIWGEKYKVLKSDSIVGITDSLSEDDVMFYLGRYYSIYNNLRSHEDKQLRSKEIKRFYTLLSQTSKPRKTFINLSLKILFLTAITFTIYFTLL